MKEVFLFQPPKSGDLLPPPSPVPRPSSYNSNSADEDTNRSNHSNHSNHSIIIETVGPGRFPLEDETELVAPPTPSPVPSQVL